MTQPIAPDGAQLARSFEHCLRDALDNQRMYVRPDVLSVLAAAAADHNTRLCALRRRPNLLAENPLTTREQEILERVACGYSNAEIACELYLSEDTVKSHLRHIFKKLGARDRAHASSLAMVRGLVDVEIVRAALEAA